jgi:hypothetical protein
VRGLHVMEEAASICFLTFSRAREAQTSARAGGGL